MANLEQSRSLNDTCQSSPHLELAEKVPATAPVTGESERDKRDTVALYSQSTSHHDK